MTYYVLVPMAIYDHGVIGVYESETDATSAAEKIWPQTDGHHSFVIHPREVGRTYDDVFMKRYSEGFGVPPSGNLEIRTVQP